MKEGFYLITVEGNINFENYPISISKIDNMFKANIPSYDILITANSIENCLLETLRFFERFGNNVTYVEA